LRYVGVNSKQTRGTKIHFNKHKIQNRNLQQTQQKSNHKRNTKIGNTLQISRYEELKNIQMNIQIYEV